MPTQADLAEDWDEGRERGFVRPPVDWVLADMVAAEREEEPENPKERKERR